jgi:hypothetical protein
MSLLTNDLFKVENTLEKITYRNLITKNKYKCNEHEGLSSITFKIAVLHFTVTIGSSTMSISHSLKQVSKSTYTCNCAALFSLQNLRKSWIISMEAKKKIIDQLTKWDIRVCFDAEWPFLLQSPIPHTHFSNLS